MGLAFARQRRAELVGECDVHEQPRLEPLGNTCRLHAAPGSLSIIGASIDDVQKASEVLAAGGVVVV